MPTFQISDPPPTVTLTEATENGRQVAKANVSFVVENKTPVKRAAVARVIAEAQDDPGIYLIEGASSTMTTVRSIDFEPNGSQTVNVTITVPRGEAIKKGAFHLRVAKDTETDDDAVDSRPIAYEAAALVAAPAPKRPFPWWAAIAAVVILLVAGVGVWWVFLRSTYPTAEEIRNNTVGQRVDVAVGYVEGEEMIPILQEVPTGGRDPQVVDTVTVDGRNVTLAFDPGVAVPRLQGEPLSTLDTVVPTLTGKATISLIQLSDDPSSCGDRISGQVPLNDANLYKTHTNFLIRWRDGTKTDCGFVPPWVLDDLVTRFDHVFINR
jgi:hypothetical protein